MSESKDTAPSLTLTPPPISPEEDRNAKDRARNKAYREANPDKQKAYYEANKERINARTKTWQKAHPSTPEAKVKRRAYLEANKDKVKAREKVYREANKDKKKAREKAYYEANKDKVKAHKKVYREANSGKGTIRKRDYLRAKYGLTLAEFNDMVARCNGRCPCCKTPFSELLKIRPCVDHDHDTGVVRGILCSRCNLVLGHAIDKQSILRACARHLDSLAK